MECRILITHWGSEFDLGMFDPISMRHEPLGRHKTDKIERIIGDLRIRMEREKHQVTFSEVSGPR